MADFPLFINMEGRNVIVIGGGSVALRKIPYFDKIWCRYTDDFIKDHG